jgi:alpha-L-arabinofuranosidase
MVRYSGPLCSSIQANLLSLTALAWLEYCNSNQDTYFANMRRANGHAKPYNVKYWALGNEIWGPWLVRDAYTCNSVSRRLIPSGNRQVEQDTKEHYAKKANQWAKGKLIFSVGKFNTPRMIVNHFSSTQAS